MKKETNEKFTDIPEIREDNGNDRKPKPIRGFDWLCAMEKREHKNPYAYRMAVRSFRALSTFATAAAACAWHRLRMMMMVRWQ